MAAPRNDTKMLDNPRFSIIVPAHNEEARICESLPDLAATFHDSEIIVVLNGCSDGTNEIVAGVSREFENIVTIEIAEPVGKGGAVRCGFLVARAPIVAFVDADGSTPAAEMLRLCETLGSDCDVVIASRWLPGSQISNQQPLGRRVASRCFNFIVRVLFGLPFADTQCGAKVFRVSSLYEVLPHVETSNMAFDVDLLVALCDKHVSIKEIPTMWNDAAGSRVRFVASSVKMFAALLRLKVKRSFLRLIIPLFDKLLPTNPMQQHDGLRILIFNWRDIRHPRAGGAEVYLHEIAKLLVRKGHIVEWITAGFSGCKPRESIDGVKITRIGSAWSVYLLAPFVYLWSFHDRFDVIVDSENGVPFFTPLFSMKPKVCLMHHVHKRVFKKHLNWPLSSMFIWIEGWLMPRVYSHTSFLTVSEDTKHDMIAGKMSKLPISVVPCGVDPAMEPGAKSDVPLIVYLGRLQAYKRIDHLIRAYASVVEEFPKAELRIAGSGEAELDLRKQVSALGLRGVFFEGFVSEERKRELLRSAWIFCSPSEMEGWGISVIEAAASGTPSVAYSVPGLREAIRDGESGVLVPEGHDLSDALRRMMKDRVFLNTLSVGARKRAEEFSWSQSASLMTEHLLQAVLGDWLGLVRLDGAWTLVNGQRGSTRTPLQNTGAHLNVARPPASPDEPAGL